MENFCIFPGVLIIKEAGGGIFSVFEKYPENYRAVEKRI